MKTIFIEIIEAITIGLILMTFMTLFVVGLCMFNFWGFVLTCISVGLMAALFAHLEMI